MSRSIGVHGMSCEGCEAAVRDALLELPGVTGVSVDRDAHAATVEGTAEVDDLIAAVEDAGYDASLNPE